ncbi:MAG: oxygen-independent coproporphyrinogen III oxidase [Lachnospiraceae bacterium]|nr:oxygen-independent coproporphyrinogen III oxidase [Lachnospiraceae bacterium]
MIKRPLGIYVHIPFCVEKCGYCDFLSAPAGVDEQSKYVRALLKEIRSYEPVGDLFMVDTVFFGGGTPSIISPTLVAKIMDRLREVFSFADEVEATIECNPGTLDEKKLKSYVKAGFNRLSLGLQSANERELKTLGRIHDYAAFENNYRLARRNGFANINVDLIFGIPGQDIKSWKQTLETVVGLQPDHISAYSLIIEKNTPFHYRYGSEAGKKLLPGEAEERAMYRFANDYLGDMGYRRYEFSNHAKKGKESRHNIKYWTMQEYLGFGLGAASYLGGKRFSNPSDMEEYIEHAPNSYAGFRMQPVRPEKRAMEEFMFLGLRMADGVAKADFEEMFHVRFESVYKNVVDKYKRSGHLEEVDERIRLTDKGIDVSNRILADFLL